MNPLGPSAAGPGARGTSRLRAEAKERVASVTAAVGIISVAAAGVLAVALHPSAAAASTTVPQQSVQEPSRDQSQLPDQGSPGLGPTDGGGRQAVGGSGSS
jgi:hypothetical protein